MVDDHLENFRRIKIIVKPSNLQMQLGSRHLLNECEVAKFCLLATEKLEILGRFLNISEVSLEFGTFVNFVVFLPSGMFQSIIVQVFKSHTGSFRVLLSTQYFPHLCWLWIVIRQKSTQSHTQSKMAHHTPSLSQRLWVVHGLWMRLSRPQVTQIISREQLRTGQVINCLQKLD